MTILTVRGIINADYLAFDNRKKLISVQFTDNSQFNRFKGFFDKIFPEVEGPSGPAHSIYHDILREAYVSQLSMPSEYSTSVTSAHSHFNYKTDANLAENLMFLCQLPKRGHTCIRCLAKGSSFQELLARILGDQTPLHGFDSNAPHHLQGNQIPLHGFDSDAPPNLQGNQGPLRGFASDSTCHRLDILKRRQLVFSGT